MRLVFIYGPPAVGKLTVATELAVLTGFRLFHNHLAYDALSSVFPRGNVLFRLLGRFRREVFAEAAASGVDLIFTFVYTDVGDGGAEVREMIEPVEAAGGRVHLVKLTCARDELLRRVAEPSRRSYRNLNDPARLAEVLAEREVTRPLPFGQSLELDTSDLAPREAAARIAAHYDLPRTRRDPRAHEGTLDLAEVGRTRIPRPGHAGGESAPLQRARPRGPGV